LILVQAGKKLIRAERIENRIGEDLKVRKQLDPTFCQIAEIPGF
jgi:hypothetical protein